MLNKSDAHKMVREEHMLPNTATGICDLVERILMQGSVQKIIIEQNRPVVAYRFSEEEYGEVEATVGVIIRNSKVVEFTCGNVPPLVVLFEMLKKCSVWNVRPVCFVTGTEDPELIYQWLDMEPPMFFGVDEMIMGFPLYRDREIPGETLVLGCSSHFGADYRDISVSIKIVMDMQRKARLPSMKELLAMSNEVKHENVYRSTDRNSDSSRGSGHTDDFLEDPAEGESGEVWFPSPGTPGEVGNDPGNSDRDGTV